ncbi:hypothetical protein P7C73_g2826, partial [Tremellales sp. Uapishka_1]
MSHQHLVLAAPSLNGSHWSVDLHGPATLAGDTKAPLDEPGPKGEQNIIPNVFDCEFEAALVVDEVGATPVVDNALGVQEVPATPLQEIPGAKVKAKNSADSSPKSTKTTAWWQHFGGQDILSISLGVIDPLSAEPESFNDDISPAARAMLEKCFLRNSYDDVKHEKGSVQSAGSGSSDYSGVQIPPVSPFTEPRKRRIVYFLRKKLGIKTKTNVYGLAKERSFIGIRIRGGKERV